MALVRIQDYEGSLVGDTAMEALEMIGIINVLNMRQYALSLVGIQESTPKGYIDDEPAIHKVSFEKIVFIGKKDSVDFIKNGKIDEECKEYKEYMNKLSVADFKFAVILGIKREETKKITLDNEGCWYRHSVEITIPKGTKSDVEYSKYIVETVANTVVGLN